MSAAARAAGFLVLTCACAGYRAGAYEPGASTGALPDDVEALLLVADEAARRGPSGPDLERSLAAAERALAVDPQHSAAAWRAARALFFLADRAADSSESAELAAKCIDASAIATRNRPALAEAFYYQALCMGARARVKSIEGLDLVKRMVEAGTRAREIDPQVLHGGPDRLLGGIFLRAPAWPASVGDLDAALEHLEAAIALAPEWAENHVLLAEALLSDEREDEARASLARARALLDHPDADGWRAHWQRDIDALDARLD